MKGTGFLLVCFLLAGAARAGVPDYPTVPVPAGRMALELPLNTYLETDYLSVTVTVPIGLRFGRYGVTNREWDDCFKAGGCATPAKVRPDEGPDNPVARVNWDEAMQYARWVSAATGKRYRLPTEQEWYYVFSLGKDFRVKALPYRGGDPDDLSFIPKRTRRRGTFGRNTWGVYDMTGNVWEWTLSCYTLSQERLLASPDLAALGDPDTCVTRVLGGENCQHLPDFLRDSYNGGCATIEPAANLGFRLVEEDHP